MRLTLCFSAEAFFGSLIAHVRYRLSIGVAGDTPEQLEARLRLCVEIFSRGFGLSHQWRPYRGDVARATPDERGEEP